MKGLKILLYTINGILYFLTVALWIMLTDELTLNFSVTAVTICFSLLLIIKDRTTFSKYYQSKWFKGLSSALLSAFLLFCILGLGNYLFYKHPVVWDLTKDRMNSLTKQSEVVLHSLKGEVIVKVIAHKDELPLFKALLQLYQNLKSDLKVEFYDIDLHPELVTAYGVTKSGMMVVEKLEKKELVSEGEELTLTNALIKVSRQKRPLIFFSEGHGELEIDPTKKEGIGDFITQAKNAHFDFRPMLLNSLDKIPEEFDVVMIWGPKTPFLESEISVLENYLQKGGKILLALDPDVNKDNFKNLRELLLKKGLEIQNSLVVDRVSFVNGSNGTIPIVKSFNTSHPLIGPFEGQVFFPLAAAVNKTEAAISEGRSVELLAFTSPFPASWSDKNPREIISGKLSYHQGVDQQGPIAIVGALEQKQSGEKIVVFGNSTFIANRYGKFGQNQVLALQSLSWLTDDDLIGRFNLPEGKDEPIFIGNTQISVIFYFSVLFVPFLLFLIAFFFFWRRRKL